MAHSLPETFIPENWGSRYPGKSVIDGPGVNPAKIAMPLRTWYWGEDDKVIKAHVAQYPATDRAIDTITLHAMAVDNSGGIPEAPKDAPTIQPVPTPVVVMSPKDGLRDFILNHCESPFRVGSLTGYAAEIGRTSQWLHRVLKDFVEEGTLRLERDEANHKMWFITQSDETNLKRARRFNTNSKQRAAEYGSRIDPDLKSEHLLPLFDQRDCYYCGEAMHGDRQIDHKVPLSRGGEHSLDNLCAACSYCNNAKGAQTEEEFKRRST